jgi:hypothetical protein
MIELTSIFNITVAFIKASAQLSFALLDEFRNAEGYAASSALLLNLELVADLFVYINISSSMQSIYHEHYTRNISYHRYCYLHEHRF